MKQQDRKFWNVNAGTWSRCSFGVGCCLFRVLAESLARTLNYSLTHAMLESGSDPNRRDIVGQHLSHTPTSGRSLVGNTE